MDITTGPREPDKNEHAQVAGHGSDDRDVEIKNVPLEAACEMRKIGSHLVHKNLESVD